MLGKRVHSTFFQGTSGFSDISDSRFSQERSPEQLLASDGGGGDSPAVSSTLSYNLHNASVKSDIWSLGATVLQFLFDQPVWDLYSLAKQFNVGDPAEAVRQVKSFHSNRDASYGLDFFHLLKAVSLKFEPSIIMTVRTANPRLQFLVDCLQYPEEERPPATLVSRGLQQCFLEIQRENRGPAAQVSSILFPGMRVAINSSKRRRQILDPLVKQQIEWNVKQEAGKCDVEPRIGTRTVDFRLSW